MTRVWVVNQPGTGTAGSHVGRPSPTLVHQEDARGRVGRTPHLTSEGAVPAELGAIIENDLN